MTTSFSTALVLFFWVCRGCSEMFMLLLLHSRVREALYAFQGPINHLFPLYVGTWAWPLLLSVPEILPGTLPGFLALLVEICTKCFLSNSSSVKPEACSSVLGGLETPDVSSSISVYVLWFFCMAKCLRLSNSKARIILSVLLLSAVVSLPRQFIQHSYSIDMAKKWGEW